MKLKPVGELRRDLTEVLRKVRYQREEVTITEHGKPVATIVPVTANSFATAMLFPKEELPLSELNDAASKAVDLVYTEGKSTVIINDDGAPLAYLVPVPDQVRNERWLDGEDGEPFAGGLAPWWDQPRSGTSSRFRVASESQQGDPRVTKLKVRFVNADGTPADGPPKPMHLVRTGKVEYIPRDESKAKFVRSAVVRTTPPMAYDPEERRPSAGMKCEHDRDATFCPSPKCRRMAREADEAAAAGETPFTA